MGVTELRGSRGPGGATSQAEGPGADLSPAPHSEGTGSPQRGFGSHHRRSLAWGQGSGLGAEAAESRAQIKHLLGVGGRPDRFAQRQSCTQRASRPTAWMELPLSEIRE